MQKIIKNFGIIITFGCRYNNYSGIINLKFQIFYFIATFMLIYVYYFRLGNDLEAFFTARNIYTHI